LKDLRSHADENVAIIREFVLHLKLMIVVVANKLDLVSSSPTSSSSDTEINPTSPPDPSLSPRAISHEQGKAFAEENDLLYLETSAKEGWGIVQAFEDTAREVLRRHGEEDLRRRNAGKGKVSFAVCGWWIC
jgi:GTPase SAR1 family protein